MGGVYPYLWLDALTQKVREDRKRQRGGGRRRSMARASGSSLGWTWGMSEDGAVFLWCVRAWVLPRTPVPAALGRTAVRQLADAVARARRGTTRPSPSITGLRSLRRRPGSGGWQSAGRRWQLEGIGREYRTVRRPSAVLPFHRGDPPNPLTTSQPIGNRCVPRATRP